MKLWSSIYKRWRKLRLFLGTYPDSVCMGVRVPAKLVPTENLRQSLDTNQYEAAEGFLVREHLPSGVTVLELGACMGIISSLILSRKPTRLVSVEALPNMAKIARRVVAHNYPRAPWELVMGAVGPIGVKEADFYWCNKFYTLSGGIVPRKPIPFLMRVSVVTLADLIQRHSIPVNSWLVMDIEGTELELARNQAPALRHFVGIIVECHDTPEGAFVVSQAEVLAALVDAGFTIICTQNGTSVLRRNS